MKKRNLEISHPDKVLFPGDGITKRELVHYYERIAPPMLPYLKDRPVNLHRFPDGIKKPGFIQQDASDYFPKWIKTIRVKKKEGGSVQHVLINNKNTLIYLAGQGTITFHTWLARQDKLVYPDKMVFDLDPGRRYISDLRFAALALRDSLGKKKLKAAVMTTGSKGYHLIVSLRRRHNFDTVRKRAQKIASELAERYPARLTVEQRKNKRRGRVFIDTGRNAYGQTSVAPYAVRARPGAPVATPIEWSELGRTAPQRFNIKNIFKRI